MSALERERLTKAIQRELVVDEAHGFPLWFDAPKLAAVIADEYDRLAGNEPHQHSWSYLSDHTGECNDCGAPAPPLFDRGVHDCRAALSRPLSDAETPA